MTEETFYTRAGALYRPVSGDLADGFDMLSDCCGQPIAGSLCPACHRYFEDMPELPTMDEHLDTLADQVCELLRELDR